MPKPLIIGIDIGVTTALAVFDLNSNLLYLESKREFPISEIINKISKIGKPLIIATDKKKVPSAISKIVATFSCKIIAPDHDLTTEEKDRIVNIYVKSPHEKDAIAAGIFAYKSYASQFINIERTLKSMGLEKEIDIVKEMVITKQAKNIAEAIEKLRPKEIKKEPEIKREINLDFKRTAEELKKKLTEQQRSYEILKIYTEKIEEKLKNLEKQKQSLLQEEMMKNEEMRKEVLKDKEIKSRDILIRQLQFELEKQRSTKKAFEEQFERNEELREIKERNEVPIIQIIDFSKDSIINAHKNFGIRDKIVWIKNFKPSKNALKTLISLHPKIAISNFDEDTEDELKESGISATSELEPKQRKFYASIPEDELESVIRQSERKSFLNWLSEYKKRI